MILRDLLSRVIMIVGLFGEVNVSQNCPKLQQLVDCANMIYSELTLEYVHLKARQMVTFNALGRADYTLFSNRMREVLSVKINGVQVPFEMFPEHVQINVNASTRAEVDYLYHAPELGLNSQLVMPPRFSEHVLAVGVASEYFYRTGLVDEAAFYKARYDNAINNLGKRSRGAQLPARRFLR
jgi:hypothetical protein